MSNPTVVQNQPYCWFSIAEMKNCKSCNMKVVETFPAALHSLDHRKFTKFADHSIYRLAGRRFIMLQSPKRITYYAFRPAESSNTKVTTLVQSKFKEALTFNPDVR